MLLGGSVMRTEMHGSCTGNRGSRLAPPSAGEGGGGDRKFYFFTRFTWCGESLPDFLNAAQTETILAIIFLTPSLFVLLVFVNL